jgi:hypothetical protein
MRSAAGASTAERQLCGARRLHRACCEAGGRHPSMQAGTAGVSPAFAPAGETLALHADATGPAPASLDGRRPPVYCIVNRPSRPKHSPSPICGCALAALNLLRGLRRSVRQTVRWLSGLVIEDPRSVERSGEEDHRLLFANEAWKLMKTPSRENEGLRTKPNEVWKLRKTGKLAFYEPACC